MSAVRIGIIGAGSAIFSMRLVSDICKTQNLKGSEVVLMDIDEDRLNAVSFLAQRISDEFDANIHFSTTTILDQAITDSNFVINSALVGGHNFLEKMRKIGEKHGYTRGIDTQEFNMVSDYYTLTNWNQLSYFLEIAQKMEHNGVKNPWLLQAANPVFEGTTLIHRQTSTNMVGFCHGHHEVKQLADAINVPFWEIEWQVAGVNHGIWLNKFERDGKNLYPKLEEYFNNRKEWHPKDPPDDQLSPVAWDLYKFYGMFPIGDTQRNSSWKYHYNLETKKKWYGEPWGGFDSNLGWKWYQDKVYTITKTLQEMMKMIMERAATKKDLSVKAFIQENINHFPEDIREQVEQIFDPNSLSGEQHIPFIDAIANDNETRLVVNTLNRKDTHSKAVVIKGLPEDCACEFPAIVDSQGIHPEEINPQLTDRIVKWYLMPRILRMEWALEAFIKKDKSLIVEFLIRDRRTTSYEQAKAVVEEIFDNNQ